jgi:signal transduction histidine kinase
MVEAAQSVVQLQQVILNLIINAIEAMSGIPRGTAELLIRTESDAAGALCLVGEVLDQKGCAVRPCCCRTARSESIHSLVSKISGSVLALIRFPSAEVHLG